MKILNRKKATSVIGAIFSEDNSQVLLTLRKDVPVWVLPGGGIDKGETEDCAIIREILEETGFTVKIEKKIGLYLPINKLTKPTILYRLQILKGEIKNSFETKQVQFFSVNQLPKLIPPPFLDWIKDSQNSKKFSVRFLKEITYINLLRYLLSHPLLVLRFILARLGLPINL